MVSLPVPMPVPVVASAAVPEAGAMAAATMSTAATMADYDDDVNGRNNHAAHDFDAC